ncbi:hypothetical protein NMG60_11002671 [Bertholletia excelsa]
MALSLSTPCLYRHQYLASSSSHTSNSTSPSLPCTGKNFPSAVLFRRSPSTFVAFNPGLRLGQCLAVSPGRPPPPESDPPDGKDPTLSAGFAATLSRLQDKLQIFLAVLFWMSLFFWASAWDGRNNGRPSKGSRFRR